MKIGSSVLEIRPCTDKSTQPTRTGNNIKSVAAKSTSATPPAQNNLYVSGLPKKLDGEESDIRIRRILARFGKITSFKILRSAKFETCVAFVAYKFPSQAAQA